MTAKKVTKPASTDIVGGTLHRGEKTESVSSDYTFIACGLMNGIKFDDVDNGNGGTKVIEFDGINHDLRGKAEGILLPTGNAVIKRVLKKDWEDIKKKHGRERIFTAVPALLFEVAGGQAELDAREDEVSEIQNGLSPVEPGKVAGVEKAKAGE